MLVVEHDEDAIRHADHIIDMGPGAGVHGGEVVCAGTLKHLLKCKGSLTADYLSGRREIPIPAKRRKGNGKKLTVHGARANNLANVTVDFPLGTFTCVTGVSGSGKSSLTIDTLYAAAARALNGARILAGRTTSPSAASSISTRSSTSTSRRSAAPRAPTPRPTPAPSPRSATGSPASPRARRAATSPAASPSTSRAAAARPARATA